VLFACWTSAPRTSVPIKSLFETTSLPADALLLVPFPPVRPVHGVFGLVKYRCYWPLSAPQVLCGSSLTPPGPGTLFSLYLPRGIVPVTELIPGKEIPRSDRGCTRLGLQGRSGWRAGSMPSPCCSFPRFLAPHFGFCAPTTFHPRPVFFYLLCGATYDRLTLTNTEKPKGSVWPPWRIF